MEAETDHDIERTTVQSPQSNDAKEKTSINGRVLGSLCEAGFLLVFRESYEVRILKRKAEKMRRETENQNFNSRYDSDYASRYQLFTEALARPTKIVIMSPIVLAISLYFAMAFDYYI
jgi:hypothetical protein